MPVAPAETAEMLRAECDDMVCLATPEDSVGIYYEDFHQADDQEVQELQQRAPIWAPANWSLRTLSLPPS
jgi:putative phosphoribosyl transferase